MKKKKCFLIVISIVLTSIFFFFSIPSLISNEKIEELLTKLNQIPLETEEIPEFPTLKEEGELKPLPEENNPPEENQENNKMDDKESNQDNPSSKVKTLTAIFYENGASSISETKKSCQTTGNSCEIVLPDITSDKEVLGWSEKEISEVASYSPNQKIIINENKTFYAITKKVVTLTIYGNGAFEGVQKLSCTYYNQNQSCRITLPSLEKDYYSLVGFTKNKESDQIEYHEKEEVSFSQDMTLYALRKIETENYDRFKRESEEVFKKINELRKKNGLNELSYSKSLELSTMLRVKEIKENYYFNINGDYHIRISNNKPFYTVNEMAYGENFWRSKECDANTFHEAFVNSKEHLNEMLEKRLTKVGIGIGEFNGYYYIVELFGIDV